MYGSVVFFLCLVYYFYVSFSPNTKARHWSSIPGFCMGVGITATFTSLYFTFQNYNESDKLSDLIKDVSEAFIGSLVGLGISLLMTYKIKSKISEIEENEQEQAGENNNPYKLLQQIVIQTSATENAIKDFKNTTAILMSDLQNTIETLLSANNRHLVDIKDGNNNNKSSIEGLKSEFVRLLDINNDEQKSSKKILKDFTDKTEQFNANLFNELIQKLEKAVREMSNEAIGKSLGNIEAIQKDLAEEMKRIFGETNTNIKVGQNDLKTSIDDLTTKLVVKINTFVDSFETNVSNIDISMTTTLNEMKGSFIEVIRELKKIAEEMGNNISEKADEIVSAKIESLKKTFERIEEYQTRSQTVLEKVTSSFKETVEKYEQVNEDKTDLIGIIGQQLKELEEVRQNGHILIQNWNDIAQSMKGMQDRINQINGVITQLDNIKTVLLTQQN